MCILRSCHQTFRKHSSTLCVKNFSQRIRLLNWMFFSGQGRGDYNWERVGPSWLKFLGKYLVLVLLLLLLLLLLLDFLWTILKFFILAT